MHQQLVVHTDVFELDLVVDLDVFGDGAEVVYTICVVDCELVDDGGQFGLALFSKSTMAKFEILCFELMKIHKKLRGEGCPSLAFLFFSTNFFYRCRLGH